MPSFKFDTVRRQKFLPEEFFLRNLLLLQGLIEISYNSIETLKIEGNFSPTGQYQIFKHRLNLVKLHYTAGSDIGSLIALYRDVVDAVRELTAAHREYVKYLEMKTGDEMIKNASFFRLEDPEMYRMALDVACLGFLLGDGDGLRQFVRCLEAERGTDLLFESIVAPAVDDPRDNTDFFHVRPYDSLLDSFCSAETDKEAADYMNAFLKRWYKDFDGMPWHNAHLKPASDNSYLPYFGYWAFEASAISIIYDIDDTPFRDHLLYPKDLADWARANHSLDHVARGATSLANNYRCEAGHPCPTSGFWSTPAKNGSRQYFKQGTVMPAVASEYGATIWQWDRDQSDPSLS